MPQEEIKYDEVSGALKGIEIIIADYVKNINIAIKNGNVDVIEAKIKKTQDVLNDLVLPVINDDSIKDNDFYKKNSLVNKANDLKGQLGRIDFIELRKSRNIPVTTTKATDTQKAEKEVKDAIDFGKLSEKVKAYALERSSSRSKFFKFFHKSTYDNRKAEKILSSWSSPGSDKNIEILTKKVGKEYAKEIQRVNKINK